MEDGLRMVGRYVVYGGSRTARMATTYFYKGRIYLQGQGHTDTALHGFTVHNMA